MTTAEEKSHGKLGMGLDFQTSGLGEATARCHVVQDAFDHQEKNPEVNAKQ